MGAPEFAAWQSIGAGLLSGAVLGFGATALATLEIEIEGPNGWAARLPTWRRDLGVLGSGKTPVTGYHIALFVTFFSTMWASFVASMALSGRTELLEWGDGFFRSGRGAKTASPLR